MDWWWRYLRARPAISLVLIVLGFGSLWLFGAKPGPRAAPSPASTSACEQAVMRAAGVDSLHDSVSDLDAAFWTCSADEFYQEVAHHPQALRGAPDLFEWVDNRCATATALGASAVCQSRR